MNNSIGANVMAVARIPLVTTNCGYFQCSPEEELFKQQANQFNQSQQVEKKSQQLKLPVTGFYLANQQKQRVSQVEACHIQTSAIKEQTTNAKSLQVTTQQVSSYQLQYQEEFNRMRERLFRLLSKVPIQVETGQSGASCSSSSARKKPDLEPLIIKYYNDRSLADILDQHFGCALMKHNFERGAPLNANLSAPQVLKLHQTAEFQADAHQQQQQQLATNQPNTCFQTDFSLNNQADSNQQITAEAYALKCPSNLDQCCQFEWPNSTGSGSFNWQTAYNLPNDSSIEQKVGVRSLAVKEDKFSRQAAHHRRNPKAAARPSGSRGLRAQAGSPSTREQLAIYEPLQEQKGHKYDLFGHQQHFASEPVQYPQFGYSAYPNSNQPTAGGDHSEAPQLVLTFNQGAAISESCEQRDNQQYYYQQPATNYNTPDVDQWQQCEQTGELQHTFSHNMIEQNQERTFYLTGEQNGGGYVVYADSQANLHLQLQVDATSQFNELTNT